MDEIVSVGQELIERDGIEGLTMQRVADLVGVKAPSLYKHVGGRGELIRLIVEAVVDDLGRVLEGVVAGDDPGQDLISLARSLRGFAHRRPGSYQLIFAPIPDEWRPDSDVFAGAVEPVLSTSAALVGSDRALEAARLVTAWAHGFLTMELAGAFRMDGDLDRAFTFGIETLAAALAADLSDQGSGGG